MFPGFHNARIFVRPGATDMRKAAGSLTSLASESMGQDPLSGSLFVFCNRRRNILKIVYWDRNGFCLWLKKLEKGRFPWPDRADTVVTIAEEQLSWLLRQIDFWNADEVLEYSRVM
jgi:transposase